MLDAQPARIRHFLVATSRLESLCPDAVERLLGTGARQTLHEVVHGNAFVEPVPGRPHCFRYQPFFREVLVAQLASEATPELHAVASGGSAPTLVERLTPRELEVLGHLDELLTTEEMAATMFVSVNTVRTTCAVCCASSASTAATPQCASAARSVRRPRIAAVTTTTTQSAPTARTSWLPVAAVATTLVLWASAFVAIRHLGGDFSPGALALGRNTVGAVVLLALAARRFRRPDAGEWWRLVVIGVLWYAVYNLALNAGERRVDAGTASLVLQSAPVFVALLAAVFLSERFTVVKALGLALAIAGVGLISPRVTGTATWSGCCSAWSRRWSMP